MNSNEKRAKIIIMGAAGRDFHNFNTVYRDNAQVEVIAFTASQISGIADRCYPPSLAGSLYPEGIPIVAESELELLCKKEKIDQVIFAYSDVRHQDVMHIASKVLAWGADFSLLGAEHTMLKAKVPVIAVSAVRTGCGKSQTTRWLSKLLKEKGLKVAAIRHPMPYGNLEKQIVQRFASLADLDEADCTVEEREEYEPHLMAGNIVYAGVDYQKIVQQAEQEVDVIVWDGGNNDFPFIEPELHIVMVDPLRLGDETAYHPGEAALRMADVVVVGKVNVAATADVQKVIENVRHVNGKATIIKAKSPITLEPSTNLRNLRVLVIEDGPTTTHGGMTYGAGYVAATNGHAREIVDPRPFAVAEIAAVYQKYPHIGNILPAMGYYPSQLKALEETINRAEVDVVVASTPCNLATLIEVNKPIIRAVYEFAEAQSPGLQEQIEEFVLRTGLGKVQLQNA